MAKEKEVVNDFWLAGQQNLMQIEAQRTCYVSQSWALIALNCFLYPIWKQDIGRRNTSNACSVTFQARNIVLDI